MSTSKRKPKNVKIMGAQPVPASEENRQVKQAAQAFDVDLEKLLSYKVYPGGKVVLIAGNGMKFVYEADDGPEPG